VIRVVLTGSESTGKTTLAERLAAHYGVEWVPEFVRDYAAQRNWVVGFDDHGPIARGQMALEDAARARSTRLLVHDTDLVSTAVFCAHYYDRCPVWIEEAARARLADLYLLLDIDVPWVPDPARDRGHLRDEVQALFRDTLDRFGARYVTVSGDWEARFERARREIDALLAARR